jgi:hypothetical protein
MSSLCAPWRRRGSGVIVPLISTFVLTRDESHVQPPAASIPRKGHGTYWIGGWVRPRGSLDVFEKRKIFLHCWELCLDSCALLSCDTWGWLCLVELWRVGMVVPCWVVTRGDGCALLSCDAWGWLCLVELWHVGMVPIKIAGIWTRNFRNVQPECTIHCTVQVSG